MTGMGILNTSPPEPSPNSIQQGKKLHIPIPDILAEKYQGKKPRHSNEMRLCLLGL